MLLYSVLRSEFFCWYSPIFYGLHHVYKFCNFFWKTKVDLSKTNVPLLTTFTNTCFEPDGTWKFPSSSNSVVHKATWKCPSTFTCVLHDGTRKFASTITCFVHEGTWKIPSTFTSFVHKGTLKLNLPLHVLCMKVRRNFHLPYIFYAWRYMEIPSAFTSFVHEGT